MLLTALPLAPQQDLLVRTPTTANKAFVLRCFTKLLRLLRISAVDDVKPSGHVCASRGETKKANQYRLAFYKILL